jgi:hypothetical protein
MVSDLGKHCSFCFYVSSYLYVGCSVTYVPIKATYSSCVQCSNMIEVMFTLEQAMKAQSESRGMTVLIL